MITKTAMLLLMLASVGSAQTKLSADFSKAANLALVTIKNSVQEKYGEDHDVTKAVNDAEAAALEEPDTNLVPGIKLAAWMRAELYSNATEYANLTSKPEYKTEKLIKRASDAAEMLSRMDSCIQEWRVSLHVLSPKQPSCLNALAEEVNKHHQ